MKTLVLCDVMIFFTRNFEAHYGKQKRRAIPRAQFSGWHHEEIDYSYRRFKPISQY
jgi:hypothetical protein